MTAKGENDSRNLGLSAVTRRFPAHSLEIEQMTASDESFGGLCDDLAAAENALQGIDRLPIALRAERRAECESWIESLTEEIGETLRQKKVIALRARRTPHPES